MIHKCVFIGVYFATDIIFKLWDIRLPACAFKCLNKDVLFGKHIYLLGVCRYKLDSKINTLIS